MDLLICLPAGLDCFALALALTGWRYRNVAELRWDRVHLEHVQTPFIEAPAASVKTRRPLAQPISRQLGQLLAFQREKHSGPLVFPNWRGLPWRDIRKSWAAACRAAGLENVRPHDLRHTFTSNLAMSGATEQELLRLGGWGSPAMLSVYTHLSDEHLLAVLNRQGEVGRT